ncbi:hypothetical protein [Streptomyces olivaceoviridis]|uniref:hypothetical protein n=1 Tax=Streptomyces olivaceoviridis TaxID=1921 RepID=UPI0036F774CC
MQSPRGQVVWFQYSEDLPDDEILLTIMTERGLAVVARPDAGLEPQMLDRLNAAMRHAIGVGLIRLSDAEAKLPEREE